VKLPVSLEKFLILGHQLPLPLLGRLGFCFELVDCLSRTGNQNLRFLRSFVESIQSLGVDLGQRVAYTARDLPEPKSKPGHCRQDESSCEFTASVPLQCPG